jgi:hypothetical protein
MLKKGDNKANKFMHEIMKAQTQLNFKKVFCTSFPAHNRPRFPVLNNSINPRFNKIITGNSPLGTPETFFFIQLLFPSLNEKKLFCELTISSEIQQKNICVRNDEE